MQNTSDLYNSIITSTNHWFEVSIVIGESGRLIDERANIILIGGVAILIDMGSVDGGYRESRIISLSTSHALFAEGRPEVGCAIAGEIDLQMIRPVADIPKKARIAVYCRVCDETRQSEWLPQGVYYVDTREYTKDDRGYDLVTIHGYDTLAGADIIYPEDSISDYPLLDTAMVGKIADFLGIAVDDRTYPLMNNGYMFPLPVGYTCREVLGMIGASYGGSFIISPAGELRLVRFGDIPQETNYLIDTHGNIIIFGEGVRLLV